MVAAYVAAEQAVLAGQSTRWGDRSLTRADLAEIRNGRKEWEQKLATCEQCANTAVRPRLGGLRTSFADLNPESGSESAGG